MVNKISLLKLTAAAAAILALVAFIAGCGGSSGSDEEAAAVDDDTHAEDHVADQHGDHADGEEIIVRAEGLRFVPDTVHLEAGETIRLKLENHDPVLHDISVEDPSFVVLESIGADHHGHDAVAAHEEGNEHEGDHAHGSETEAHEDLQPLHVAAEADGEGLLVFQAPKPGEYKIACTVEGHRDAGMVGILIVE